MAGGRHLIKTGGYLPAQLAINPWDHV